MTTKAVSSPAFEALLGDLQTMAKAIDVNQERIAAGRAAEGHMQHGESMAKSEEEKKREREKAEKEEEERKNKEKNAHGGKEHKEHGKEHMAKSFSLQTEDGSTIEVVDASDMLKALGARLDQTTASVEQTFASLVGIVKAQDGLTKSLIDKLNEQGGTIESQGALIKSMQETIDKLGSSGAGRKAVVTLAERQSAPSTQVMAKAGMPEGVTTEEFFAKALDMQREGRLTGVDISLAETCINHGQAVPETLVRRVLGHTTKAN